MPKNKEFLELIAQMQVIHEKKNDDYSSSSPDENFERMAIVQGWFGNAIDKSFVGMVAVKLARLGVLLSSNREPNNESIEDSFLDLCTYCTLWAASYKRKVKPMGLYKETAKQYTDSFKLGAQGMAQQIDKHYSVESISGKPLNLPLEIRLPTVFLNKNQESDPRIAEIFNIADKLPENKLALLTAEARRLVM